MRTCASLDRAGVPTVATNLNYPSIGVSVLPGAKTVIRTVTNVSDERERYRARVDQPEGYDVEVSPNRITLDPGESARFEVTFINEDAPLDEWRFGSLSWQSGRNRVRSPIAVKAAAIEFPDSVGGTGGTGNAAIPVAFGYTGAYTAAPHGLSPDQATIGTVAQDPDQAFDPADPTGTTAHPFTLAGSAHLRITLDAADLTGVDPDATDIDLYLFLDGAAVAQSTSGGTAEIIDISQPEDGNYILYVHGWQLAPPTATAGYTFHFWDVPEAAGGGSLAINASPPAATQGTVGIVEVGWADLAAGTHLGALSHTNDTGLLGYTLVEVDAG